MPRQRAIKPEINFSKGLLTEASPLNYPDNFFEDGDNVEVDPKGKISRRLALNAESAFSYSSLTPKSNFQTYNISEHIWKSPGGDASKEFYILKLGATLYFYDNTQSPRSSFTKPYTINLDNYLISNYSSTASFPVTMDYGFRRLFIVGEGIKPLYVNYDTETDNIEVKTATIEIRDFDDIEDGIDIEERPNGYLASHEYNMRNRGWISPGKDVGDPFTDYFSDEGVYPSKNKQWWVGKDSSSNFSTDLLDKYYTGTTSAPRGHFIIEAFNKQRALASGVSGVVDEIERQRPNAVAFAFGRIFWAYKNTLYFNRVVKTESDIGKCYQNFDPTSEEISDLLDDDGGEIPILGASNILAIKSIGPALVVYADNGTWSISGADGIFRATGYSLNRLSSIGISSPESLVEAEGFQFFWADDGIYSVSIDKVSQGPELNNITFSTINTFYSDIPEYGKATAKGIYDKYNKKVRWIYLEDSTKITNDVQDYTKVLTFDLRLQAFLPSSFPKLSEGSSYPAVVGISSLGSRTGFTDTEDVTVGGLTVTVDSEDVVILVDEEELTDVIGTKFLVAVEDGTSVKYTFCEFNDREFYDFKFVDSVGVSYSSYFEPGDKTLGDLMTYKQAPYIMCYSERTEQSFISNGDGTYDFDFPSSLKLKGYWDWSDANGSVTASQECYRFPRNYVIDTGDLTFKQGHAIIVTKNKLRGKGRSLRLKFESEAGKDFRLYGLSILTDRNQSV